jgi:adenosine/AMP kinase
MIKITSSRIQHLVNPSNVLVKIAEKTAVQLVHGASLRRQIVSYKQSKNGAVALPVFAGKSVARRDNHQGKCERRDKKKLI